MPKHIEELITAIEDIENDDEIVTTLSRAMHHYCNMWDMCEGFKHAIIKTLEDQYENHGSEQSADDVVELKKILSIA